MWCKFVRCRIQSRPEIGCGRQNSRASWAIRASTSSAGSSLKTQAMPSRCFRPNPLTGEILNASINVDGSLVQFFNVERNDTSSNRRRRSRGQRTAARRFRGACSARARSAQVGCPMPGSGIESLLSCRMGAERQARGGSSDGRRLSLLGVTSCPMGDETQPHGVRSPVHPRDRRARVRPHSRACATTFVASTQFSTRISSATKKSSGGAESARASWTTTRSISPR